MFSEWLALRSVDEDPKLEGNDEVDMARGDRALELARMITTTPATLSWMIYEKLAVLEHYMCGMGEGTGWRDNRELVMLAGFKADIIAYMGHGIAKTD